MTRTTSRLTRSLALAALLPLGCDDAPATPAADAAQDAADAAQDSTPVDLPPPFDAGPPPTPYAGPDDWCPGRDHCTNTGDNRLFVGAAREVITPEITETYTDRNGNNSYDDGEPYTDANGNGEFDGVWIAGFGNGRAATGVHDPLEVRALAFRYNDITVVWAVIDTVGYFINEMDLVRQDPMLQGMNIDKVIISATHVHEAVDTVGLWGRDLARTGLNRAYQTRVRTRTAAALRAALTALRPVRMRVAQTATVDAMGSTLDYVNDTRDPVIYDPTVTVVQFVDDAMPTQTVATLVNWAAHPEYTGSENTLLSADYVHYLRATMEMGIPSESVAGLGGTTVFVNGALGGQVGPGGGVHPRAPDGMTVSQSGLRKAELVGTNVARLALAAIQRNGMEVSDTALSYRTAPLNARVENIGYGIFFNMGIFERELFAWNPAQALGPDNFAWVRSRVTYFQVGPVAAITAPGELHPELFVGFDARWSWGQTRMTQTANPPDYSRAPTAPFLRDLMLANPGVRYPIVAGLSEDFLGYIVPAYNYALNSTIPYILEADGDHYEETNSIGPEVERYIQHPMMELTRWRPTTP
jgi:hypothetical protein